MDLGQSRRGVDMGPSAVRYAGLGKRLTDLGYVEERFGNLEILDRESCRPKEDWRFSRLPSRPAGASTKRLARPLGAAACPWSRVATILSLSERSREWPPISPWACCGSTPTPI
jgi:hypothetical protein